MSESIIMIVRAIAVLVSAMILGNMFLTELNKIRRRGLPWYKVYLTIPGAAVLLFAVMLPIMWWLLQSR